MSANVKSLFIGAILLIAGLIPAFAARGVRLPVVAPDKVGVVLVVLAGIELVVTVGVMLLPSRSGAVDRE